MRVKPYPFEQLVKDTARQQAAKAELLRNRAEGSRLAHQALQDAMHELTRTRYQRNVAHEGTPPEEALGSEAKRVCTEFLEFMETRNYPGSHTLNAWSLKRSLLATRQVIDWTIRGYPIGYTCVPNGELSAVNPTSQVRHSVYLCIDGNLRSVPDLPSHPLSVSDLPVDVAGKPLPVETGYYSEKRQQPTNGRIDPYNLGRHCYMDFNPQHLDRLLAEFAVSYL